MKASVLRYAAIGMASLSLAGFAAASTVSVSSTGPDSPNKVKLHNSFSSSSFNLNATGVTNTNVQGAYSGDVKESDNTTVSGGGSGNASNSNTTSTTVSNNNGGGAGGALAALAGGMGGSSINVSSTGPDSKNNVDSKNSVKLYSTNLNLTEVDNTNVQSASSGNVNIHENTTASGGSSGNASNNNNTVNTVSNSN